MKLMNLHPTQATIASALANTLHRFTAGALILGAAFGLAACGSMQSTQQASTAAAQMTMQMAAVSTPSAASAPAGAASQAASPDDESGQDAIGTPTDAMQPQDAVNLGDSAAQTDLWARVRKGFAVPDMDNSLVHQQEQWYAARPDYVQRMTERSSRYLYHVLGEIERRHMPSELALLPFIESAFNPQAMSVAKASGMWQFVPSTGKDYDLTQNIFRDDRRDVLASTRAALDYLQRLYGMFGDWQIALAAYNWGEGNVQRAIARNQRAGLPTDYGSLNMPAETRNYYPKLQAVKNIISHPEAFGLNLPPVANHPYFVSVPIKRDLDAALAAKLAGMSLDEFHDLNPSLKKPVILANGTPQVLLPYDNAEQFARNLAQHRGPLASWTAWVVPRTMRPVDVAKKVGMSEAELRNVNHIPPRMLVKAGSTLLVPRPEQRTQNIPEEIADNAVMSLAPDVPPMRRMIVRAGKRDSVSSLARRYRVSASQLAQWNKLSTQARLGRGQRLVVYVPIRSATRTVVARAQTHAPVRPSARPVHRGRHTVVAKTRSKPALHATRRNASNTVAEARSDMLVR